MRWSHEFLRSAVPIRIVQGPRRLLVLCPVSKLNKIPKSAFYNVQASTDFEDSLWKDVDVLTSDGCLWTRGTQDHDLFTKVLTDLGIPLV